MDLETGRSMDEDSEKHTSPSGLSPHRPFHFSCELLTEMAALLSHRRGRAVSLGEADEALTRLTEFFKALLSNRNTPESGIQ